jgi:DUF4097 and DUF4098 domain-containing protein YvlB
MSKILGILFVAALSLAAQEKATVPLHDPSRPVRVRAHVMSGSIRVRGADINNVVVEAGSGRAGEDEDGRPERTEGMKRLDLPGRAGLDITEDNNVVEIKTGGMHRPSDLVITVPRHTSLELKSLNNGEIDVEQVEGEIDVNNLNGRIELKNVSGSAVAHSLNGAVVATFDRIDPSKPMSFSTLNGDIDVTLPGNVKANLLMKTDHGSIYSDFDVKLGQAAAPSPRESGRQTDGTYHLRFDQTLRGTIEGGGPDYQFTSFNGQIYIRKKK